MKGTPSHARHAASIAAPSPMCRRFAEIIHAPSAVRDAIEKGREHRRLVDTLLAAYETPIPAWPLSDNYPIDGDYAAVNAWWFDRMVAELERIA